jgi:hypothetical protein
MNDRNLTGLRLLAFVAAIVLFILAIFIEENQFDLLAAGLAAFAAAHITW